MKVRRVSISNFRGVRSGSVLLDTRSLLVGGNAVGKSTVCEALDLVLGLERLYRRPVIDEYDFHQARYRSGELCGTEPSPEAPVEPEVRIEVVLTGLSEEALRRFAGHLRPWSAETDDFAPPAADDATELAEGECCLPVVFLGRFSPDEDDFEGSTFFAHPQRPEGDYEPGELGGGLAPFRREDKRFCGYLYLRPNRTGSRALSFGRGSLIDTIVRLESDKAGSLWTSALDALDALDGIDLAESTPGFGNIRTEVLSRVRKFLAVGFDLLRGRRQTPTVRALAFALGWSALETTGVAASAALWAAGRGKDHDAHFALQRWWADRLLDVLRHTADLAFEAEGIAALAPGPIVVCARHASLADALIPVWLLSQAGMRPRYVLKDDLQLDPCLDIVGNRLPNHFVDRDPGDTSDEIAALHGPGEVDAQGLEQVDLSR